MSDRLVKFMAHVDMAKITCIESTELVETAREAHNTSPVVTAALGRLLTAGCMMGTSAIYEYAATIIAGKY